MIGERGVSATRQPHYQPRVLLAEDDECTLRVVQKLLQKCGYEGEPWVHQTLRLPRKKGAFTAASAFAARLLT